MDYEEFRRNYRWIIHNESVIVKKGDGRNLDGLFFKWESELLLAEFDSFGPRRDFFVLVGIRNEIFITEACREDFDLVNFKYCLPLAPSNRGTTEDLYKKPTASEIEIKTLIKKKTFHTFKVTIIEPGEKYQREISNCQFVTTEATELMAIIKTETSRIVVPSKDLEWITNWGSKKESE